MKYLGIFLVLICVIGCASNKQSLNTVNQPDNSLITYRNFDKSNVSQYSNLIRTKDSTILVSQKGNRWK